MQTNLHLHNQTKLLNKCLKYIELLQMLKAESRKIGYALIQQETQNDPVFKCECDELAERVRKEYDRVNERFNATLLQLHKEHNKLKQSELLTSGYNLNWSKSA